MSTIPIPAFVTCNISTDHHRDCKWATVLSRIQKSSFLRQPLVIVGIMYNVVYLQRPAAVSEYRYHPLTILWGWNCFSPSLRPSLFLTSLSPLLSFLHSSKKAAKWCFSSLTYRHQPQPGVSQWQKINIWVVIRFVLPVAGIIVADKQQS